MDSRGILYFLNCGGRRGDKHGLLLFTAIDSLRRIGGYHGQVLICCGNEEAVNTAELVSVRDSRGPTSWEKVDFDPEKAKCYAAKTNMGDWSPFEQTIYTDTDTLWVDGMGDQFWANDKAMVLTQFADWTFSGKKTRGRIAKWREFEPEMVDLALSSQFSHFPSINTGCLSWRHDCKIFEPWKAICEKDPMQFIADESAMMVLMPSFLHDWTWVSSRFNWSPIHDKTPLKDAACCHGHGGKFFSREQGQDVWVPYFLTCYGENRLGIREYLARHSHLMPELIEISKRFGGVKG